MFVKAFHKGVRRAVGADGWLHGPVCVPREAILFLPKIVNERTNFASLICASATE